MLEKQPFVGGLSMSLKKIAFFLICIFGFVAGQQAFASSVPSKEKKGSTSQQNTLNTSTSAKKTGKVPSSRSQRLKVVLEDIKKEEKQAHLLHSVGMGVSIAGFAVGGLTIISFIVGAVTDDLSLNLRFHATALYLGVPLTLALVGAGLPMWGIASERLKHAAKLQKLLREFQGTSLSKNHNSTLSSSSSQISWNPILSVTD